MKKIYWFIGLVPLIPLLVGQGCPGATEPPAVDLGADQTLELSYAAVVNATVTGGTQPFDFLWEQVGGSQAVITEPDGEGTLVVPGSEGSVTIRLTVTDATGQTGSDEIMITSSATDAAFQVEAGPHQTVAAGQTTTVTAEAIDPPDATDVSYAWSVQHGNATLVSANKRNATVTAPTNSGEVVLLVIATSGEETARDVVFLTVPPALSVVIEDDEKEIVVGQTTSLQAVATGGNPPYLFQWQQVEGVSATTTTVNAGTTSTLSVTMQAEGQATFRVTVTDSADQVAVIDGTVTATSTNNVLSVSAGADQVVDLGDSITLTGTVSGGTPPYDYLWTQVDGPAATISTGASSSTNIVANADDQYTFRLTVTDATGDVQSDDVVVTVESDSGANFNVDAGPDQVVNSFTGLLLTATVQPNTDSYNYNWTADSTPPGGPLITLLTPASASTQLISTGEVVAGDYVFSVGVTNLVTGETAFDSVTITIE